jgi:hypothetical protein
MVEKSCITDNKEAKLRIGSDSGFVEHNIDGIPETVDEPGGSNILTSTSKGLEALSFGIRKFGSIVFISVELKDTILDDRRESSEIATDHKKPKVWSTFLVQSAYLIRNVIKDSTVASLKVEF